ncbi:hypothetical protein EDB87DRAFT_1574064 [Lactarius vividus]|nr:hypothetical protein EDB87DRAFT_1574064 [Lactarius vividus]
MAPALQAVSWPLLPSCAQMNASCFGSLFIAPIALPQALDVHGNFIVHSYIGARLKTRLVFSITDRNKSVMLSEARDQVSTGSGRVLSLVSSIDTTGVLLGYTRVSGHALDIDTPSTPPELHPRPSWAEQQSLDIQTLWVGAAP